MLENFPNAQVPIPGAYPLGQMLLRPIQHQLAKQGIDVSPEEALKLLEQKGDYDAKRYLQQDLADRGIDVSQDEACAIQGLRFIHLMMVHTGTTDTHEAIERMASYDPSKPYEPNK